jgi:hypothetical protein
MLTFLKIIIDKVPVGYLPSSIRLVTTSRVYRSGVADRCHGSGMMADEGGGGRGLLWRTSETRSPFQHALRIAYTQAYTRAGLSLRQQRVTRPNSSQQQQSRCGDREVRNMLGRTRFIHNVVLLEYLLSVNTVTATMFQDPVRRSACVTS